MRVTLNLSDEEARIVHRLLENELQSMAEGGVPEDEEYKEQLNHIIDKLER